MKNLYYLILIFFSVIGCKKKEIGLPSSYDLALHWGSTSYLMNGMNSDTTGLISKKNTTKIAAVYSDSFYSIIIHRFTDDEFHFQRETISFNLLKYPPKKEIFIIGGDENNLKSPLDSIRKLIFSDIQLYRDDGDVGAGNYAIDKTKKSSIEITDYDSKTNEIKGKFNVFYRVYNKGVPWLSDTLSLRNGIFHTKFFKFQ